uniref:Uncharacterized protein n=1 Tax=viral metagenome TaxID=1070528 RepID=A0A6C0HA15_9ZZZZ
MIYKYISKYIYILYMDETTESTQQIIYEQITQKIQNILINKQMMEIKEEDININDNIYIIFMSYSQKYIYSLYPKYGTVMSIDNNNIIIKNINNENENILHDNISYFGDSLGYEYTIYKII